MLDSQLAIIVPTRNAGELWCQWLQAFDRQKLKPRHLLLIDSASSDDTVILAKKSGFDVWHTRPEIFSHGGTRQEGLSVLPACVELVIFMTQDAVLAGPDAIENLLQAFEDPLVGAAFGRQLPHANATAVAAHARQFNYPAQSRSVSAEDRKELGIKACFLSNSFAAYRVRALQDVGGFPSDVILGEDTTVAARLLLAGGRIYYQASACVRHSHNYTPYEEFNRYFDTGVFHARSEWLLDAFGTASGEGKRFVNSEMRYLFVNAPAEIPSALWRTGLKLAGYRLGRAERSLPISMKRRFSMFKAFWGNGAQRSSHQIERR